MTGPSLAARIGIGAVCGLAWAAALRAYMSEINGFMTEVTWIGTFVGVLLPGVIMGAAIGAASGLDVTAPRQRAALRWCAASVLAFAVFPLLVPGQLQALVTAGFGSGAIGVALGALAGGYAIGGRRTWARVVCLVVALVTIAGVVATVPLVGGGQLGVATPRGVWVMLLVGSLLVVMCVAAAVPFRRLSSTPRDGKRSAAADAAEMVAR